MMNNLPLTICYDDDFKFVTQTRRSTVTSDDELLQKENCNRWQIFSPHNYFMNEFHAETFACPNAGEFVYFRLGKKLEIQFELDTLLVGALKNGRIVQSKRYGQGFLEEYDYYPPLGMNDGSNYTIIELPGFNDAVYNWETFNSNEFFMLFQSDAFANKYGFDIELTCQKPIEIQNTTISGEECLYWSDIFEDWPKVESVNGNRTYEFLPGHETLRNVTYITWNDNRNCDSSSFRSCFMFENCKSKFRDLRERS